MKPSGKHGPRDCLFPPSRLVQDDTAQDGVSMRHVAVLALLVPFAAPAQDLEVRSQWSGIFEERGVEGTIVVFDSATRRHLASDNLRSREQYVPASTFKIPHTLFALEAGVVSREPDV